MMGSKNAATWAARQQAALAERDADDLRAEVIRLRKALKLLLEENIRVVDLAHAILKGDIP